MFYKSRKGFQKPLLGSTIDWGHPLARGLIGCWLLNEGKGSKVQTLSNITKDGELQSGAFWIGSKYGNTISFDGTNDIVNCGLIKDTFTQISWEVVAKANVGIKEHRSPFGNADNATQGFAWFTLNLNEGATGPIRVHIWGSVGKVEFDTTNVTDTNWHHWVCTYNSANSTAILYQDGRVFGSNAAMNGGTITSGNVFYIGKWSIASGFWKGEIAYVRLWKNRILSQTDVYQLYKEPYCFIQEPIYKRYFFFNPPATGVINNQVQMIFANA